MKTVKFLLMALVATAFVGCNDSDDSTSKIQLDTPAPAVDESTITTTSATVTWSAISNAASYEVQLDGATVQTVTSPSVSLSSLTAGTSYTVGVRAIPGDTEAYEASKVGTCSFTTSDESGEGGGEGTSSLSGSNYYLISLDTETYETIKDKVVADFRPNEVDCFLYDWAGSFTGGTCAGPNFYGVVTDWGEHVDQHGPQLVRRRFLLDEPRQHQEARRHLRRAGELLPPHGLEGHQHGQLCREAL